MAMASFSMLSMMLTKYKILHRRAPAEIYRDSKDTFAIKETDSINTCYIKTMLKVF